MESTSRHDRRHNSPSRRPNTLLIIGACVLIVLLLVWLTVAMFTGDTDVAAFVPVTSTLF